MRRSTTAVTILSTGALLVPVAPALAGHSVAKDGSATVVAFGACTAGTTWRLGARASDNGIGVRFALDSAAAGQPWILAGAHNWRQVILRVRKTDADGKIVITRHVRNLPGVDVFRVRAKNRVTKEICRARLLY